MKISIIIPCYNVGPYLSRCVESVLAQTYSDFEVILIDDGSQDDTGLICKNFSEQDPRVRYFFQENSGVSVARNLGIAKAMGEFVMFVDGDDFIEPNYIERFYLEKGKGKWVICGFTNVISDQIIKNAYYSELLKLFPCRKLQKRDYLKILEYYSLSSPCARIYEKNIIIDNCLFFQENLSYQEDLVFNLNYLSYVEQVILLDYYGYYYVQNKNSSTNRWHQNFNQLHFLFKKITQLIIDENDKLIIQKFLLNTILRKISNIYHPYSPKKYIDKSTELKEMFESDYFKFGLDYYNKSFMNIVLKHLFRLKSPFLFYLYFNLRNKEFWKL